jgi:hypothetical protein
MTLIKNLGRHTGGARPPPLPEEAGGPPHGHVGDPPRGCTPLEILLEAGGGNPPELHPRSRRPVGRKLWGDGGGSQWREGGETEEGGREWGTEGANGLGEVVVKKGR